MLTPPTTRNATRTRGACSSHMPSTGTTPYCHRGRSIAFRTPDGLAIIRHYALNENMMFDKSDQSILGYFVADIERAGPYCMMGEALAVAHGDPTMIGYLVGSNFGRGFPLYVRNFNANFLALPALPSSRLGKASPDPDVIVREIRTAQHGTWLAVVNTSMQAKRELPITVPSGQVQDAVTGKPLDAPQQRVMLELYPFQLRSLHVRVN